MCRSRGEAPNYVSPYRPRVSTAPRRFSVPFPSVASAGLCLRCDVRGVHSTPYATAGRKIKGEGVELTPRTACRTRRAGDAGDGDGTATHPTAAAVRSATTLWNPRPFPEGVEARRRLPLENRQTSTSARAQAAGGNQGNEETRNASQSSAIGCPPIPGTLWPCSPALITTCCVVTMTARFP